MKVRVHDMVAACALMLAAACTQANAARTKKRDADSALARDYVFAACLIDGYPRSPLAEEAEVWAQAIVEQGNIAGTVYPELAQLAQRLAVPPKSSRNGRPMVLQSCLALYNSPELRTEIARLLR